jgi:hypothetical protein
MRMRRAEPGRLRGKGGRRGLTTADAEEKRDIEEGVIRDDDLWYGNKVRNDRRVTWRREGEKEE